MWVAHDPATSPSAGDQPASPALSHSRIELLSFLGGLVVDSPSRGHTLARLHGAHAALHAHGVGLELPRNLSSTVGPGLTTTAINRDLADRIRGELPGPAHAAALSALLCTGLTPTHLASVQVSDLTADASALILDRPVGGRKPELPTVYPIPAAARA